jgi:hypothetical protein
MAWHGMALHGMAHTSHCTWHVRVACASKSRHFIDSQSSLLWVPAHALQAAKTWAVTFECEEVRLQRCSDSFASANVHSISRMNHSTEALASADLVRTQLRLDHTERPQVRFTYDEDGQLQADDFFTPYICELFSAHVIFDHAWAV